MKIRFWLFSFITLCSLNLTAQIEIDWIEVYEDQSDGKTQLYAHNKGFCPVTIKMSFPKLENLKASKSLPIEMVIPNDGEEHLIVELESKNKRAGSNYYFDFQYALGDVLNTKHEEDFVYTLPFQKGKKSVVGQGYDGKFSHRNLKALDFDLNTGTEVLAARGGTVVAVKKDSNKGCRNPSCKSLANYILIHHSDGTFGSYVHLQKNGAKVKEGDIVEAGQIIGISGNTGWSSGPHLHFEVYVPEFNTRRSVKTKFRISNDKVGYLESRKSYHSK